MPRFEFRSFGQNFESAARRMARLSAPVPEQLWERISSETYVLSCASDSCNIKIRDGKLDIKKLVETRDGLERWTPLLKADFPLPAPLLTDKIFPALGVEPVIADRGSFGYLDFLSLVRQHSQLMAVRVYKQRFGYLVNDVICETGNVLINGARVVTISAESEDIGKLKKAISDIGLDGVENINYLQAIKVVTGMDDRLLSN